MFESLKNYAQAFVPSKYYFQVVLLLLVIAALSAAILRPKWKEQRPNFVLVIVIAILLVIVMRSDLADRWSWILGLVPTLLVAFQAFYLWLSQPKPVDPVKPDPSKKTQAVTDDLGPADYRRASIAVQNQFGLKTLFLRYGFPAALLAIIGIVAVNMLIKPGNFFSVLTFLPDVVRRDDATVARILMGLRIGAVGAYVYVLLELGRRTFRHDVTAGSAMWCLVTLILGPVLAATVALLWRMDVPQSGDSEWWAGGVVLFFAGYAPRRVVAAIEQAAVQLLKLGGSGGVVPTRQVPLTQIRGISPQIEERLSEEGIEDVNALAAADPLRLFRNTSFDLRQLLTWIDEAILMVTVPRGWEALEEEGITGAIDFASHEYYLLLENQPSEVTAQLKDLADKAKMSVTSLRATMRRLNDDHQLRYIWALYNRFTEAGGGTGTGDGNTG